METVRTPAQQKAYDRWKKQHEAEVKSIQERKNENARLLDEALMRKYRNLPEVERKKSIKKAKKKSNATKRPRAHVVSGGLPSLGKR